MNTLTHSRETTLHSFSVISALVVFRIQSHLRCAMLGSILRGSASLGVTECSPYTGYTRQVNIGYASLSSRISTGRDPTREYLTQVNIGYASLSSRISTGRDPTREYLAGRVGSGLTGRVGSGLVWRYSNLTARDRRF